MAEGTDEASVAKQDEEQEQQRKKEMDLRKAEALAEQSKITKEAASKAKDAEALRKKDDAAQKVDAAALTKAKKEAGEKEKQLQLAKQKEEEAKKIADAKAAKEADDLAKQQEAEAQRIKELKSRQDADALAKAEAAAAEKKRLQDEALAKKKVLDAEKQQKALEEIARKEEERKAANEKLAQLEAERKQKEAEKAYSEVGLWQRYGKKGIDVYNFPAGQMPMVNADFFIAADTLRNFRIADSLINNPSTDKLNIVADKPINGGVTITLENIAFKDVHTFYKVRIDNKTNEDFLLGKTYMYWYDQQDRAKMIIKCSYLTYINFYPIVRPGATQYIVFATRSPNVIATESLVLFIEDRRKEKGVASIVIGGKNYIEELAKVQTSVRNDGSVKEVKEATPETETKSNKKSRRKKSK